MLHEYRSDSYTGFSYFPASPPLITNRDPELYLAELGHCFTNGHFSYEQVPQVYYVHVITAGVGTMRVNGTDYTVGAGDLFCFFPGKHYVYFDRPESPWRYSWMTLAGQLVRETLAVMGITEDAPHAIGEYAILLEPLIAEIIANYSLPATPPTFPIAAAWRCCDLLLQRRMNKPAPGNQDYLAAAEMIIGNHLSKGLTVAEIAAQLSISRSHLFRLFRAKHGISPKAYLNNIRLERAAQLLRQSASSVAEIAAICGFQDSHYFSYTFKKRNGVTPSQYRAEKGNG
jgi:AraC-like DNA-binding protein